MAYHDKWRVSRLVHVDNVVFAGETSHLRSISAHVADKLKVKGEGPTISQSCAY